MTTEFSQQTEHFEQILNEANSLSYIARDSDLQRAAIKTLAELSDTLKDWKREAIESKNEDRANQVLGMECLAMAIGSELKMWLQLKAEQPEGAWRNLVAAQTETNHAIRAHASFAKAVGHARYLGAIEAVVFPPQRFLSAGLIVRRQICTICNSDYEDCDHLVGMPYWGEFCFRKLTEFTADHVAIVDEPANKNCRITHFSVPGGKRNRMTWRIEPAEDGSQNADDKGALTTTGVLLSADDLIS
jgi:hypothetical protein